METQMIAAKHLRHRPSRRALLLGGASFAAWAYLPKFARAADGRDPRLVVVILRGALDGLATVAPIGDPDYAGLHGSIALTSSGPNAALPLDSFFALHPAMPEFARMYRDEEGRGGPRGGDAVSRAFAFRRTGRARKRLCRAGPGAVRLAQPRAGRPAEGRAGDRARLPSARPRRWCCAARRRPSAGRRSTLPQAAEDTAMRLRRTLSPPRSRAGEALTQGLALDKTAQGDDMKPKPGDQRRRRDAAGGARRRQADGGR